MDLNTVVLGNPLSHWLIALGLAVMINVGVSLLKWLVITRCSGAQKLPAPDAADHPLRRDMNGTAIAVAKRTRFTLIFIIALSVGARYLELPERGETFLNVVTTIAAFLQMGLWISGGLIFGLDRYRERRLRTDASAAMGLAALGFVGRVLVWSLVLLLALSNLGVDVTALVAGLGIGGIAVALAVQNILGDLFASLSIVIDKPFVIGDFIIVDDFLGTVEYVGLKTTRIRSLSGEQVIFSNSDLLNARVRNFKRMYERRVVFHFGVLYQTTPEQLEWVSRTVREIIERQKLARFDRAHFFSFDDSSLRFEVVYWMRDPDFNKYMDVQEAINLGMMRAFADAGVSFAYPTRTLVVSEPVRVEAVAPNTERSAGQASPN